MRKALSIALLGLFAAAPVAQAGSWSASLDFVSDYRFRGISQTNGDPALQIGGQYSFDNGLYLGTWASNVDFVPGDGANTEVDLFVGFGANLTEDLAVDAQLLRYIYPSTSKGVDYDYTEVIASLTFREFLTGSIAWSNDVFASDETGIYYNLAASHTVFDDYTISGGVGYYDLDDLYGGGYTDLSVGVSRAIGPLNVGLSWVRTNRNLESVFGPNDGSQFVFSIGTSFPYGDE